MKRKSVLLLAVLTTWPMAGCGRSLLFTTYTTLGGN